jgi:hypothetical protein
MPKSNSSPEMGSSQMLTLSVLWLVAVNLVPLAGVLFLGWDVSAILFLYWAENLVVGLFNLLKMKMARGTRVSSKYSVNNRSPEKMSRRGLMFFFMIHYGMFTLVHGVFVMAMFGVPATEFDWLLPSLLLLFVSHGMSFIQNFIRGGEVDRVSYQDLFIQPYARVVIMHLTIIFGGFMAQTLGSPPSALLVLVALKTGIDIFAHLREHRKAERRTGTGLDNEKLPEREF